MKINIRLKGLANWRNVMKTERELVQSPDLYDTTAQQIYDGLITVGKGWPTAKVKASMITTPIQNGVDISFTTSSPYNLRDLQKIFEDYMTKSIQAYIDLVDKELNVE